MNTPFYPQNLTSQFSAGSFANLLNPLSFLFNGKQYVPSAVTKAFSSSPGSKWNNQGGAARMAHLATKIGLLATIAGLGTWGARALAHSMKIDNIQNMDPSVTAGQKLTGVLQRPTEAALQYNAKDKKATGEEQPKKKKTMSKKQSTAYNLALGTLPLGATLLAMVSAMSLADKHYDKKLGKRLDKDIQKQRKQSEELAKKRIFANRLGDQPLQKTAGFFDDTTKALGLLGAVILSLGIAGGYNWQRSNSKRTAEYKAAKKGLETYNTQRQLASNIDTRPIDPKLMALFNSGLDKNKKQDTITSDPMKEILI